MGPQGWEVGGGGAGTKVKRDGGLAKAAGKGRGRYFCHDCTMRAGKRPARPFSPHPTTSRRRKVRTKAEGRVNFRPNGRFFVSVFPELRAPQGVPEYAKLIALPWRPMLNVMSVRGLQLLAFWVIKAVSLVAV